jgi:hypothetical protein
VSARAQTGASPVGIRRHSLAAALAMFGGGMLLVEVVLAALLFGLDIDAPSPTRTALLLAVGGLVALGAAQLVPAAPRLAPLLAWLLAASPLVCAAILAWRQARTSPSA